MMSDAFIVMEWQRCNELVDWCKDNVGHLIWSNNISEWIGYGWAITRVRGGFEVHVDDPVKCTLALLKWT